MAWFDLPIVVLFTWIVVASNIRRNRARQAWLATSPAPDERPPEFPMRPGLIMLAVTTVIVLVFWYGAERSFTALGFAFTGNNLTWWAVGLSLAYVGGMVWLVRSILGGADENVEERDYMVLFVRDLRRKQFGTPMKYLFVSAGGAWEELMFRGYLFWLLDLYLPLWAAFAICASFFGLTHCSQGLRVVLVTSGIGAVLTGLRVLSGGILLPALVHALHNSSVAYLVQQVEGIEDRLKQDGVTILPKPPEQAEAADDQPSA